MFEHILIAYDGSEQSERALEAGARLARGVGARVTLFHCLLRGPIPEYIVKYAPRTVNPVEGKSLMGGLYDAAALRTDEIEEIGRKLVEKATATLEGYGVKDCETMTGTGDAAHSIVEYARKHGVDTIVTGSRGHGPMAKLVLGSVSHKLLYTFDGAILTVR